MSLKTLKITWIDWIVHCFYVPANKIEVIWETVLTGQKSQPTVSKY